METGGCLVALLGVLAVAIVVLVIGGLGFGWFTGEANLRSFNHVKETYQQAFDDINGMKANAEQGCEYKKSIETTKDESVKAQRESQLLAIQGNFDRTKGEYEAYMRDHFRGGVIRPHQLPLPAPTFREELETVCQ